MDLEAGRTENFESYFENVISHGIWNASAGNRLYGVTQSGQRFVLMLIYNLYYFVCQAVEPHDESFCLKPVVTFERFENKNLAKEHMENTHKKLTSQTKIHRQNDFDNFAAEKLKAVWGREVYRIRDYDVDGNPFAVVLKKNGLTQPQVNITKWFLFDETENRLQMERNKLKRNKNEGLEKVEVDWFYDVTKYKDKKMELLPIISNISSTEPDPYFAEFVENSFLCSFRGEEVYRRYRTTDTGRRFCFVVSKMKYYVLHVVLEPYLQERFRSVKNDIEMYSQTIHLPNIKNRTNVDRFVSEKLEKIVDKLQSNIDACALKNYTCTLQTSPLADLCIYLRRGDHLRRNLKVRRFNVNYHDGIYLGNGKVAHYTTNNNAGFFKSKGGSGPGIVTLEEFLNGEDTVKVAFYLKPSRSPERVAEVAEYLINNQFWDKQYNLVSKNCQLFAYLCTTTKMEHQLQHKNEAKDVKGGTFVLFIVLAEVSIAAFIFWFIPLVFPRVLLLIILCFNFTSFLVSFVVIVIWCIQTKSLKETMKLFIEIENRIELKDSLLQTS